VTLHRAGSPPGDLNEQINHLLPQTQCGKCGYPGCAPYAAAIAAGDAINKCPPGGEATIQALARLLRRPAVSLDASRGPSPPPRVAFIREAECIGCTKCIQACPLDAILGAPKLMHTVIAAECSGCDLCLEPCPVDCIDLLPLSTAAPAAQERTAPGLPDAAAPRQQRNEVWRARYEFRVERLARETRQRGGSRRRSVTRPETPDIADDSLRHFSREQARTEIAAAVARVKARRQQRSREQGHADGGDQTP
jgi:electron transport complex protein RnfB